MLLDPHRFSEEHRRSNPHLFAFFHASGLDARHETYRARLDTDSRTVKGGSARGINAETFLTVISRFKVERCRRSCDASVWCSIWTQSSVTESSADVGPNISGRFNRDGRSNGQIYGVIVQENLSTGPFYATEDVGRGCAGSESFWAGDLMFDAHRANAVYGESTVQPSSCRLLLCIKA